MSDKLAHLRVDPNYKSHQRLRTYELILSGRELDFTQIVFNPRTYPNFLRFLALFVVKYKSFQVLLLHLILLLRSSGLDGQS